MLNTVRQELDCKPENPNDESSAQNQDQIDVLQQEAERKRKKNAFDSWLEDLRSSFLQAWTDHDLSNRLTPMFGYRSRLNKHLNTSLNIRARLPNTTDQTSDIVEILSMHQALKSGLQPLGALLIRKNGDSLAMTTPLLKKTETQMRLEPKMSLIRYDLSETHDLDPQKQSFIQTVPNLITMIKAALYFREEADRLTEVKQAHKQTFGWIFERVESTSEMHFRQWLERGDRCFWISGKAGSGKSTLMKFIHGDHLLPQLLKTWAGSKQLVMASFFFWYAGRPLQKSYEGMLRSLLHQILDVRPELTTTIFPGLSRFILSEKQPSKTEGLTITMQELREAMRLLVSEMPKDLALFLLVDGVDEYDGDHHDFSNFLVDLANTESSLKILLSSRPIPACSQIFSEFPKLRLQDLTVDDIIAYIDAELLSNQLLLDMDLLEPGFAREIETALIDKASGVFLWIVLVVRALLKGLGEYDDRATLMKTIDNLPNDLEDLYDHMFQKMSDKHQQQGSLLLQLIVRARDVQQSPLTALQLFIADKCNHHENDFIDLVKSSPDHHSLRVKAIDGKLRSKCCGLVEVQYQDARGPLEEPRTDFLHRTVYDYLRNPSIWGKVTKIYDITLADIDIRLLVSIVHVIKTLKAPKFYSEGTAPAELLAACLEYSETMSCIGDTRYVKLLRLADSKCLMGSPLTDRASARDCYHAAYQHFMSRRHYSLPEEFEDFVNEDENNMPADWTSALVFARLNFPDYFEIKIRKDMDDLADKSLLLKLMLALCASTSLDLALARAYSRNIHALLKHGAGPNMPARTFSQGSMLFFPHMVAHSRGSASRDDIDFSDAESEDEVPACSHSKQPLQLSGNSTPWEFWLFQDIKTIGQLHITIHLLEADACVDSKYLREIKDRKEERELERRLHGRLVRYKANGIWPEGLEYAGSQELLPHDGLLLLPPNPVIKRLSPSVEDDVVEVKRPRSSPALNSARAKQSHATTLGSSHSTPIIIDDD